MQTAPSCSLCPLHLPSFHQVIERLGREINHPDSIYYWAWRRGIPVFCPALTGKAGVLLGVPGRLGLQPCSLCMPPMSPAGPLSSPPPSYSPPPNPPSHSSHLHLLTHPHPDGSLGDMLYFHTYTSSPRSLVLDIVGDIRAMNDQALRAAPRKTGAIILGGGELQLRRCTACCCH